MSQKQLQIQKQSLNISPQQLMLVGMLSCNVQEIEEKIKKELEENPALEKIDRERETPEAESYNSEDEYYNSEYSSDADYRQRENAD